MHDAVALEAAGLPVAAVVTSEFVREARTQLAALGMSALEPVVIGHPLSSLTEAEIDERARQATELAKKVWLGSSPVP